MTEGTWAALTLTVLPGLPTLTTPIQIKDPCSYDINHVLKANRAVHAALQGQQACLRLADERDLQLEHRPAVEYHGRLRSGHRRQRIRHCGPTESESRLQQQSASLARRTSGSIPAAFSIEAPGTLGNLGRNTVRGPHYADLDFSVTKETKISERINTQFRAEFFNILNHTNLGLPAATLFVNTGGTPTGSAGQITTIVGTPRQIQFALKIIF